MVHLLRGVPLQGWRGIQKTKLWGNVMLPLVHVGDKKSESKNNIEVSNPLELYNIYVWVTTGKPHKNMIF